MTGIMVFITVVQIISAIAIIILVLLQHGKGADMGAAFGSGASGSLFGASGTSNFLSRMTAIAAGLFFVCTLLLAFNANNGANKTGVLDGYKASTTNAASVASAVASTGGSANAAASASSGQSKANQIPQ